MFHVICRTLNINLQIPILFFRKISLRFRATIFERKNHLMTLLKELKSTYPAQGNALRSFECTPGPSSKDPKSPLRIAWKYSLVMQHIWYDHTMYLVIPLRAVEVPSYLQVHAISSPESSLEAECELFSGTNELYRAYETWYTFPPRT